MADVVANGVRHHVQLLGEGQGCPVVFLHGLVMDNLSSWYFTAANPVAKARRVILYDIRGHGRSERPPTGYDVDTLVADLRALLEALDAPRVQLVGNSFGGLVALAFAVKEPERVERMALVDAHVGAAGWTDAMVATLELEGEQRDRKILKEFADWHGRHRERKRTRLARAAEALVKGTSLIEDLRASPALSDEQLARVRCPVLALYGQRSDVREAGEHLASVLPGCQLRILPGCSHSVLWEATDELREQLVAWCTSPESRP